MATVITMVGFIGMMEAVTIAATTMDHARRQTFATQVLSHEIDELYFLSWATISTLPAVPVAPALTPTLPIDPQFWPNWNGATNYVLKQVVAYSVAPPSLPPVANAYYRCILAHANQPPCNSSGVVNATYWAVVTPANPPAWDDVVIYSGATFTLARTVTSLNPVTNMRQVNFTVTWTVVTGRINSGVTQGGRTTATGADDYATNLRRADSTHTRVMSAWYGKYGLPLSYPQS